MLDGTCGVQNKKEFLKDARRILCQNKWCTALVSPARLPLASIQRKSINELR